MEDEDDAITLVWARSSVLPAQLSGLEGHIKRELNRVSIGPVSHDRIRLGGKWMSFGEISPSDDRSITIQSGARDSREQSDGELLGLLFETAVVI